MWLILIGIIVVVIIIIIGEYTVNLFIFINTRPVFGSIIYMVG